MKKKVFSIIISIIIFSLTYFLFGIWGIFEINKHHEILFKSEKNLIFHKKYSKKIHHLRDSNRWNKKDNEHLFSIVNESKDYKKILLLQGDSWIEQISENLLSESMLKKFSNTKKLNTINAGITSFAPSLMNIQYKILKNDFNISPNILIIYVDQTDIGDEVCRYAKNKIYSNLGEFKFVKNEKYSRSQFDYTKIYEYSELYLKNNKLNTILKFPYIKLRYFFLRNKILMTSIISNGWKNRNNYKCTFYQIQKELLNFNKKSKKIFQKSLSEYLIFLKEEKKLEKILVVTFPHKKHHENTYKVNISNYIDDIITNLDDKRFSHLNFSMMNFSKDLIDNMYQKDHASHLKNDYHAKIFLKEILSKLEK